MAGGILKNCRQAPQITFQLTSGLAAYIIWVAANIQTATFGPAGLDREQAQEGLVLAYILTADKPLRSPFRSPLGLQLTF